MINKDLSFLRRLARTKFPWTQPNKEKIVALINVYMDTAFCVEGIRVCLSAPSLEKTKAVNRGMARKYQSP